MERTKASCLRLINIPIPSYRWFLPLMNWDEAIWDGSSWNNTRAISELRSWRFLPVTRLGRHDTTESADTSIEWSNLSFWKPKFWFSQIIPDSSIGRVILQFRSTRDHSHSHQQSSGSIAAVTKWICWGRNRESVTRKHISGELKWEINGEPFKITA